jgi:hypothetical protein
MVKTTMAAPQFARSSLLPASAISAFTSKGKLGHFIGKLAQYCAPITRRRSVIAAIPINIRGLRMRVNFNHLKRLDPVHCRRCYESAKPGFKFPGYDRPCRTHCEMDQLVAYIHLHGTTKKGA